MRQTHETLLHPRLFYAFVDLQPEQPVVYVVPSEIVADVLMRTHRAWLATPGKGGRPHKDSKIRRILPWLPSPIPGYEGSWLEAYRERWDLLAEDRRLEQDIEE